MEVISLLIPMALILAALFIGGFIWMTRNGQYDDMETPRHRMLLEDNEKEVRKNITQEGEL